MRHKLFIFFLSMLLSSIALQAQTINHQLSLYNGVLYNPAVIAQTKKLDAGLLYQTGWTKVKGAPYNITFNVQKSVFDTNLFTGIKIAQNSFGAIQEFSVENNWAYKLVFDNQSQLFIGMNVGIYSFIINLSDVEIQQQDDPYLIGKVSTNTLTSGIGVYYVINKFKAGGSIYVPLIGGLFEKTNSTAKNWEYHGSIQAELSLIHKNKVIPFIGVHKQGEERTTADFHFDVHLSSFISGFMYQTDGFYGALIGLKLKKTTILYNYRINPTVLKEAIEQHELMLTVSL